MNKQWKYHHRIQDWRWKLANRKAERNKPTKTLGTYGSRLYASMTIIFGGGDQGSDQGGDQGGDQVPLARVCI